MTDLLKAYIIYLDADACINNIMLIEYIRRYRVYDNLYDTTSLLFQPVMSHYKLPDFWFTINDFNNYLKSLNFIG